MITKGDMRRHYSGLIAGVCLVTAVLSAGTFTAPVNAQRPRPRTDPAPSEARDASVPDSRSYQGFRAKPIIIQESAEPLSDRLDRSITLDVREMNVVDVLKFLALKGDFNLVTSSQVQGRVTLYLKNVLIRDALDIVLIANGLAYHVEHGIVHVITEQEYQAMYGKKFNDKNEVRIVKLDYAKPSYVLSTLENLKSDLGRIIIDEDTGTVVLIDTPQSLAAMTAAIEEMESPLEPIVYTLQYARAEELAQQLQQRVDAQTVGSISVDERTNKLVVRAYPGRRNEVESLIKELDSPTKEVLVEVRVLQVTFRPQMDFGIDWNLDFRHSSYEPLRKITINNILMNEDSLASSDDLGGTYGRLAIGDFDANSFNMAIRALKQVSDTKILSNPKLLVTNNEEAKIHVGDTVPYIISTTSGTGENAITSEDVRFVDVGLKLNVTPKINEDGMVTMALRPEISTVSANIESQGGGIPQVNKTLVETTVMVKDGMTVVLGGLKKDNKTQTTKGIPFLMDIPALGRLFRNDSESVESTEIVIFITPHIITGTDDEYDTYRGKIKEHAMYTAGDAVPRRRPKMGIKE
ncbi:MAG: type II secretion system protein GspD [Candidatus Omnitrophota bacterium]